MNILLLAMSTINSTKQYKYHYTDEGGMERIYYGRSQLVPGTKCILDFLARKDEKLDRVIVINTNETLKKADRIIEETKEIIKEISPYEFYKMQIEEYLRKKNKNELPDESLLPDEYSYADRVSDFFVSLNKDEYKDKWDEFLSLIVKEIYSTKGVNLYVDTQGGDRNTSVEINGIVDILKTRKVHVVKRIGVDLFDKNKDDQRIRDVDEQYRTYDLYSAMNEFIEYGKANGLNEYFKDNQDQNVKALLDVINEASSAIQICNVEEFEKSLYQMREIQKQYKDNRIKGKFDIIYSVLSEEYNALIVALDKKNKYITQIEWCLKKGFIQQALTIFEAKMPYEYVVNGIKYYLDEKDIDDESKKSEIFLFFENEYNNLPDKQKYKLYDLNHYFIKDMRNREDASFTRYGQGLIVRVVENNIWKYRNICNLRNTVAHAETSSNDDGFLEHIKSKGLYNRQDSDEMDEKKIEEGINDFLKEFKILENKTKSRGVDLS